MPIRLVHSNKPCARRVNNFALIGYRMHGTQAQNESPAKDYGPRHRGLEDLKKIRVILAVEAINNVDAVIHLYSLWHRLHFVLCLARSSADSLPEVRRHGAHGLRLLSTMRRRTVHLMSCMQARRGTWMEPLRLLRHGAKSVSTRQHHSMALMLCRPVAPPG